MIPAIFFYLFAGVSIAAAVMVIASRNPVHSVLFLILAFVNGAGLFVLLGAEFLAMILIIVYVGAVIGIVVLIELLLLVVTWTIGPDVQHAIAAPIPPLAKMPNTEALGHVLY